MRGKFRKDHDPGNRSRATRRQLLLGLGASAAFVGQAIDRAGADTFSHMFAQRAPLAEPWMQLPPTPDLPAPRESDTISVNGVPIFYARFGKGPPVLLLHGGMGHSNYWGHQVRHLADRFDIIAIDTRGHGRSPLVSPDFGYDRFAQDAVGLMDRLAVRKAAVVGWSDGAITGLELAMNHPERVERLFAFAGNLSHVAMKRAVGPSRTFADYVRRCKADYAVLSPDPDRWPDLMDGLRAMWRAQADFTPEDLARIKAPTVVADGAYDEIIKPRHVTDAAALIEGARPLLLPRTSHFAMLQDPTAFNAALDQFLTPSV